VAEKVPLGKVIDFTIVKEAFAESHKAR